MTEQIIEPNDPIDTVDTLFNLCRNKQETFVSLVKDLRKLPNLKEVLAQYMKRERFRDDDLILFNWFIGTKFNICINDLK